MDNKRAPSVRVAVIAIILLFIIGFTFYINVIGVHAGNAKADKEYSTTEQLLESVTYKVNLPSFVSDDDNLKLINKSNGFIEIIHESYVLMIGSFVNNLADPLNLYEHTLEDEQYTVSDSNISFLRIRRSYPNYDHCTIINWVDGDAAYGLIWGNSIDNNTILTTFNLSDSQLSIYEAESQIEGTESNPSSSSESSIEMQELSNDKIKFSIPNFVNSEIKLIELPDMSLLSFANKTVCVFIYDNVDKHDDDFRGQSELVTSSGIVMRYMSENPFELSTDGYNDYEYFLSSVNEIADSVEYFKQLSRYKND